MDFDRIDFDDFDLFEGNDAFDGDTIDDVASNPGWVLTNFMTAWTQERSPFFNGVASASASVSVFFLEEDSNDMDYSTLNQWWRRKSSV